MIVNFIIKLPLVAEKDVIFVVYNRISKMIYFAVTIEKTLAKGLTRIFRNNMWKLHRLPESVISNRGLYFAINLIRELNQMLEI